MRSIDIVITISQCITPPKAPFLGHSCVGYAPAALRDVNELAGSAFVPVSGSVIDVADLVGTGYDPYDPEAEEGGAAGEINLQTTDEYGRTVKSYFWNDFSYVDEDTGDVIKVYGWLDLDDEPIAKGDCTIAPGEGFLLKCDGDGFSLQSSGSVLLDADCVVELHDVNNLVANPTPVNVDLKNCYVTGYDPYDPEAEEGGAAGEVNAQVLNKYGETLQSYFWNDFSYVDEDTGDTIVVYGWLDLDDEPIEADAAVVGSGIGFLVKCDGDGWKFAWPKVVVK